MIYILLNHTEIGDGDHEPTDLIMVSTDLQKIIKMVYTNSAHKTIIILGLEENKKTDFDIGILIWDPLKRSKWKDFAKYITFTGTYEEFLGWSKPKDSNPDLEEKNFKKYKEIKDINDIIKIYKVAKGESTEDVYYFYNNNIDNIITNVLQENPNSNHQEAFDFLNVFWEYSSGCDGMERAIELGYNYIVDIKSKKIIKLIFENEDEFYERTDYGNANDYHIINTRIIKKWYKEYQSIKVVS
jgi:hypothetical protein